MKTDPPDPRLINTAHEILDMLQTRRMTVNEAVNVITNVCSNMIISLGSHDPEQCGQACARMEHVITGNVTAILKNKYGKEAEGEFNAARFATTLECLTVNREFDLVSDTPREQPKQKETL